jgi:hypothetical protein
MFGLPLGIELTMTEGVARAIHPADRERVATALERIRDDPSPFALEHRIIRTDGEVRSVLARGEGVVDEDGRLVRFIGADQDITDRRRADAERRRLLGRVYEAQEGQDRRLAADLHDGLVQSPAAIGFDPDHVQVIADIAHFGLIAMRERVEALGGRFRVTTGPGRGTVIEATLPLTDPTERWET